MDSQSYKETDKFYINENNLKFLKPQQAADLYKVMSKINFEHIEVSRLTKPELYSLFYGVIFTLTVSPEGSLKISHEDMQLFSEIMSECYSHKFSDVEYFFHSYVKDLEPDEAVIFNNKVEKFRLVLNRFEGIIGKTYRL